MLPPHTILFGGRYVIQTQLGAGIMAEVYLATDTVKQVDVALKLLRPDLALDPTFEEYFRREARVMQQLQHPNIVRFYEPMRDGELLFLVLDYIDGPNLQKYLFSNKLLPIADALHIAQALATALDYAHASGVIHRDLKPSNVLLAFNGAILLSDFGVARVAGATTTTTGMVGSPAYMAPEQIQGAILTRAADQYSLAVLLWELIASRRPFVGASAGLTGATLGERVLEEHLSRPPPTGVLPKGLDAPLRKALAKNASDRFPSCTALVQQLVAGSTTAPTTPQDWQRKIQAPQLPPQLPPPLPQPPPPPPGTPISIVASTNTPRKPFLVLAIATALVFATAAVILIFVRLAPIMRDLSPSNNAAVVPPTETSSLLDAALAFNTTGFAKYELKQYEAAIADYDKAIALDPTLAHAFSNRGLAKCELKQCEAAIADFNKAIALDPTLAIAFSNRGLAKHVLKQYEAAIADFNKAIALDPALALAFNNRGFAKYELKQYEAAIADYDKAIALDPTLAIAFSSRGFAKHKLKQYEAAIADFNKAIDLDPTLAIAFSNRGVAKYELKQYEAAIADFNKAIDLDPNDSDALVMRAMAAGYLGDTQQMCRDFNAAAKLGSDAALQILNSDRLPCSRYSP